MRASRPAWGWLTAPAMVDVMMGLVAAAAVTSLTALATVGVQGPHLRPIDGLGYALVALSGAALMYRTADPCTTFGVTLGLGVLYEAAGYPSGPAPLPIVVALFTIAERGSRQRALGFGLLASVLIVGARQITVPGPVNSPLFVAFPTAIVAALYAGQIVAGRRTHREEAVRQAAETERVREQETARRIDAERLRIARELHDVVAHNISLINVQATMGVHLMDQRPAEAAAALAAIKQASKQALRELRRILDVLRQADEAEPTAAAPGLADLDALVGGISRAGLPIQVRVVGAPRPVPATVDVAAFRIIQESLTNALRYAGSSSTHLTLGYHPESLTVDVTDDGDSSADRGSVPQGFGHGIAGMRERASAVGGTLRAGPVHGGGFAVNAALPLARVLT